MAIITSHPIQYNAPLFRLLALRNNISIKVFYTWGETVLKEKYDPGFGKVIKWDIPLLDGYDYEFVENIATDKGSHHFKGIINPGIIGAIDKFEADAVLVFGWSFDSHLKVIRYYKKKIPVLFRGDSTLLDKSSFLSFVKRYLFLNWVYGFVDIAFYVGTKNYEYFRKFGLKKEQLVFASHAVENERFVCKENCLETSTAYRNILSIPESDSVILFAGKLEQKKDPVLLLRAFKNAQLPATVHLVMVGNGIMEKELKKDFSDITNIHFLDFQNQEKMPAVYKMADVFVLPSQGPGETWGLAVNEAMANGKAIIVSNKCGCADDLVENDKNGYIFEAGNLDDLKNKLIAIFSSKEKIALYKKYSQEKIKNNSIEKIAQVIEDTVNL